MKRVKEALLSVSENVFLFTAKGIRISHISCMA